MNPEEHLKIIYQVYFRYFLALLKYLRNRFVRCHPNYRLIKKTFVQKEWLGNTFPGDQVWNNFYNESLHL